MTSFLAVTLLAIFASVFALAWVAAMGSSRFMARYHETFTASAQTNLRELFMFIDPRQLFQLNLLAIAVAPVFVYYITRSLLIALIAGIAIAVLPKFTYQWMRRRRLKQFEAQLPEGVVTMAGALRAGASLPMAIDTVVREMGPPVSQEFGLLVRENRIGVALDDALQHMADRIPSPDLGLVISAMRIAREVGGTLPETLDRLADTLRQKAGMEGKIRSLTAQGKLQGWVVGLLPLILMIVLFQIEPEAMRPLLDTAIGWAVLALIAVLEILGIIMIRKIVAIDV